MSHSGPTPTYPLRRKFLIPSLTGILAGLAGVTSSCGVTDAWAAMVIGFLSAVVCYKTSKLLAAYQIDDPVDAVPVHLCGGAFGIIATGFFATDAHIFTLRKGAVHGRIL